MTTALSLVREQGVAAHSAEEWQALKETVAKGTSPAQFHVFVAACRSLGLDPFKKQVYCWADSTAQGGITIYTSVAGLRALAVRTGHYRGQRGPFWCAADGVWTDEWISDTPPVACKFGVVSDLWDDVVWAVVRMASYAKTSGQWTKAPEHMLAKVAESLALRRAFPDATSGVYSDAEVGRGSPSVEAPEDYVDAEPVTTAANTLQHGRHTVDRATGEVLDAAPAVSEGSEPSAFADEPPAPKWPEIQQRALAAGVDLDTWPAFVQAATGMLPTRETMKRFTTQHKRDILRAIREREDAAEASGDAQGERAWPVTADEPTAPDNGEDNGEDNGNPNLLRDLPALQGSVRP